MNRLSHIPWILGMAMLLVAAGWYLHSRQPVVARETVRFIDRPVALDLPPKHDSKPSRPAPVTPEQSTKIEALIRRAAEADSLEYLSWSLAQPQQAFFEDTIAVADTSWGSIEILRFEHILVTPADSVIQRDISYGPSKVNIKEKVITREIPIEPTFWDRLYYGLPVAAVIVVIVTLAGG